MRKRAGIVALLGALAGCSGDPEKAAPSDPGHSGEAGQSGSSGASGKGGTGAGGTSGGAGDSGAAGDGMSGGAAGSGGGEPVPLPPGSREVNGIVNLVDALAAAELETFLTTEEPIFVTRRQDLARSFNLFVDHYVEEYDFVFFYTDHYVENAYAAGIHQALTLRAEPGGSSEIEIALGGYKTNGRTKSVIAMLYDTNFYGPLAHEVLHYWANDLDTRFGFGLGLDEDWGAHWGHSSVNGRLGGFDGTTLRCETPANAVPPGCDPPPSNRTRYVVGEYAPFTNTFRGLPYAPLELYLMGLAPASEVPSSFQLLTDATIVDDTRTDGTVIVEASGIDSVEFSAITARHGQKPMLGSSDRAFRAAFVVVSAEPASDAVMNDIARMAAAFGNREMVEGWHSFQFHTDGRATLETRLGTRRDTGTPAPAPRELFECDVLAQDCARPELGCYLYPPSFCALSGNVGPDEPCNAAFACVPGFDCVASNANPTAFVCKPYCDPTTTSADDSCEVLCPGTYAEFQTTEGEVLGGLCFPP